MLLVAYIALSCTLCLLGYLSRGKFFNPLTMFSGLWLLVVSLSYLQLSGWQSELSDSTIIVLMGMLASFGTLFLLGNGIEIKRNNGKTNRNSIDYSGLRNLFSIWCLIEILEIVYSGGLPIFWHLFNTGKTYFDFGIPSVHGVMNALGLVIILIATNLSLKDNSNRKSLIAIVILILLYYLMLVTRQVLISALIEILVVVLLNKPQIVVRKIIPIAFLAIIAFGIVGNMRTGYEAFLYVSLIEYDIPPLFIGFYWVYMYLTMTITNINNLIMGGFPAVGMNALSGFIPSVLAPYLGLDTGFFTADYLVTNAFNVSGFFVYFYQGFKISGVLVISAIYGLISGVIYRKSCEETGERNTLLFAVLMQIVLLSFFDNMLLYLPSSFQFVILLILYRKKICNKLNRGQY